ncbi:MAG: RidA family protein [Candidatus Zixiibacteriota bacterium]
MSRKNFSSGAKWESIAGYSRAVKVGSRIYVSGTTSVDENGAVVGKGDPYKQAIRIFTIIETVLKEAGSSLNDVIRTRMFVTDIAFGDEIIKAHAEYFKDIRPAATMVEVNRLIDPDLLVEIEVDADTGE